MTTRNKGMSTMAMALALVAVVAVLGGLYMWSDVFRTKADRTLKQLSEWTPENIAKDPAGYLDFCETKAKEAQLKLKASKIALKQKLAELTDKKEKSAKEVGVGETAIAELKELYRSADGSSSWPLKWQGKEFTQDSAKSQIVLLAKSIESKKSLLTVVTNGLTKLQAQEGKLQQAEAQCVEQLEKIVANREMLKVKEISDDLKDQLVSMRGVLEGVVDTASDSSLLTLDDLSNSVESKVGDKEFDKIMAN